MSIGSASRGSEPRMGPRSVGPSSSQRSSTEASTKRAGRIRSDRGVTCKQPRSSDKSPAPALAVIGHTEGRTASKASSSPCHRTTPKEGGRMTATARKLVSATQSASTAYAVVQQLLARLGDSAQHGASVAVVGRTDARRWAEVEDLICTLLDQPSGTSAVWSHIPPAAARALRWRDWDQSRRTNYRRMVDDFADRADVGLHSLVSDVVRHELERALLWGTAWHLLAAGVPMSRVLAVLREGQPRGGWRRQIKASVPVEYGVGALADTRESGG